MQVAERQVVVKQTHDPARTHLSLELVAVAGTPPEDAADQVFHAVSGAAEDDTALLAVHVVELLA